MSRNLAKRFGRPVGANRSRLLVRALFSSLALTAIGLGFAMLREPSASAAREEARAEKRPNFVVVMTDDQDLLSMRKMRKTKRVLGKGGVEFENFYTSYPLCSPSRATLLTGQYAHNHGVRGNHPPDGGYRRFDDRGTSALALQRDGYRTGFVGKFMNGYPNRAEKRPKKIPRGFDTFFSNLDSKMFDWRANDNGKIRRYGDRDKDYLTDVESDEAVEFIRESSKRTNDPFYLTVQPLAPHGEAAYDGKPNPRPAPRHEGRFENLELPKPPSFNEEDVSDKPSFIRDKRPLNERQIKGLEQRYQARAASLLAVDDMIGRIKRTLKQRDEWKNTYVIFTSDNGRMSGQHRWTGKSLLYEESVRVPMLIRGPGIPEGEVRTQQTSNVDLAPTILDAAGTRPLVEMDGISMLPLIDDPSLARDRELLLENSFSVGLRSRDMLYAEHKQRGEPREYELYDLTEDPYQLQNIYDSNATSDSEQARLAARVDELRDCAGSECNR